MIKKNSQPQINNTETALRAKYSNKLSNEEVQASRRKSEEKNLKRMAHIAQMSDLATDFPNHLNQLNENEF